MRKKLLAVLLAMCMAVSLLPAAALADSTDHWAASSIERWTQEGVLDGSAIDPDAQMTRAEFAQMLCNLMGYTETSDTVFSDLDADNPAADAISKLVKAGVMNGVGDGRIDPNGTLTREQAAVMLCRALDIKPSDSAMSDFKDSDSVSSWAAGAMAALTERGMMNGVGDGLLAPGGLVNNGTAAALVDQMVGEYVTEDKTITGEVKGIVLVVKGAKADIKDATLSDPVVVKDAAAALTNTKADDVVANGGTVTTDAATTVANVTLTGEAPKATISGSVAGDVTAAGAKAELTVKGDVAGSVELKGETPKATIEGKVEGDVTAAGTKPQVEVKGDVAGSVSVGGSDAKVDLKGEVAGGVTVTEDATGKPAVTAPKGTEVTNESGTDASVNGGTVAAGDNTTTTTNPPSTSGGGSSTGGGNGGGTTTPPETDPDPEPPAGEDGEDPVTKPDDPTKPEIPDVDTSTKGEDEVTETNLDKESHTCSFSTTATETVAPTCQAQGYSIFKCTEATCTATKKVYTAKVDHAKDAENPVELTEQSVASTCYARGFKVYKCQWCDAVAETVDDAADLPAHTYGTGWVQGTGDKAGKHWHQCTVCGHAEQELDCVGEGWVSISDTQHKGVCKDCKREMTANHGTLVDVPDSAVAATCTQAGKAADKKCPDCNYVKTGDAIDATGHDWSDHNGTCKTCQAKCPVDHATILKTETCGTCGAAGTKEPEATTKYSITLAADSEQNIKFQDKDGTEITTAAEGEKVYIVHTTNTEVVEAWAYKYQKQDGVPGYLSPKIENDGTGKVKKYITMPAADVTVRLTYQYYISVNPTTGDTNPGHVNVTNGTVVVSVGEVIFKGEEIRSAAAGKTVTLTVTPNTGYQLKTSTFKVNDGTSDITVTMGENNTYTFTMPAKAVTVTVEFEATTPSGGGT